jgi:hypothetical protein
MHALRVAHEGVMRGSAGRSQTSLICRFRQTTDPLHTELCNCMMQSGEALQATVLILQIHATRCKRLQPCT